MELKFREFDAKCSIFFYHHAKTKSKKSEIALNDREMHVNVRTKCPKKREMKVKTLYTNATNVID